MDQEPLFNPERRIVSPESRIAYKTLKDSIRVGYCKMQELKGALAREEITLKEYTELITLYVERLENIVGIDPLTNLFDSVFLEPKLNELVKELNHKRGERKFPIQAMVMNF